MKILLAEDTADLNRAICAVLTHEGHEMVPAYDGEEAISLLSQDSYDCIILDIMMPGKNGIEVLTYLRGYGIMTPVLLLTAKAEVDDKVTGLDAGADDYLTKPFAMKELLARIRALTRRKTAYSTDNISYHDITLRAGTLELISENAVRLSLKEFALLQTLLLHAEHPMDTSFLLSSIWEGEENANADTLYLYISYLRRKLDSVSSAAQITGEKGGSFCLLYPKEEAAP
ncbi:MAG: response regulator transcription factor [Blautia sp.]|nr:response regulator transcription factor [Blautia sp.]